MTCPHGMPTPASCVECMEEGNLPTGQRAATRSGPRPSATASFEGKCSACSWVIEVDDALVLSDEGEWIHEECVR